MKVIHRPIFDTETECELKRVRLSVLPVSSREHFIHDQLAPPQTEPATNLAFADCAVLRMSEERGPMGGNVARMATDSCVAIDGALKGRLFVSPSCIFSVAPDARK